MDSINDLLSSISPQDMEKIKSVASGLLGGEGETPQSAAQSVGTTTASGLSSVIPDDVSGMLMQVAAQMNKDSDKTAFIKALRPLLSEERQHRADEAMRFMKLMDTLPLLRGML